MLRLRYPLKNAEVRYNLSKAIFPGVGSWKNIRFNSERMTANMYKKVTITVKGDRLFSILILF